MTNQRLKVLRIACCVAGLGLLLIGSVWLLDGGGLPGGIAPVIPSECECSPATHSFRVEDLHTVPEDELAQDHVLTSRLSASALRTANACGLVPLLRQCLREEDATRRLELRQQLAERLTVISLEISSTAGELDCEEERADQIADYLLSVASTRKTNLTLWSIIIGAVGTVVTNVVALRGASQRVYRTLGILFGLVVAVVSIAALRSDRVVVEFVHQRNALAELRSLPSQRQVLPPAVWNYLTWPDGRCGETRSLRDRLIDRWERSGGLAAKPVDEKQRVMALLFGPGGTYRASELSLRGTLFDQLE
jgi:hypothetical protein